MIQAAEIPHPQGPSMVNNMIVDDPETHGARTSVAMVLLT